MASTHITIHYEILSKRGVENRTSETSVSGLGDSIKKNPMARVLRDFENNEDDLIGVKSINITKVQTKTW